MIEESKYYSEVMKIKINRNVHAVTKEDDEEFGNSTKWWICDNAYVGGNVKVRDHDHITEKL